MKRLLSMLLAALLSTAAVQGVQAQDLPDFKADFLDHFNRSSSKLTRLATVIPAEKFTWSPSEEAMSIARVYGHIAKYNFNYLEQNLGIAAPLNIDANGLEELTDKEVLLAALNQSIEHVNKHVKAMTSEDLHAATQLYGRDVAGWSVLLQLLAHMNEHVGQTVSYARMNNIAPPWSM